MKNCEDNGTTSKGVENNNKIAIEESMVDRRFSSHLHNKPRKYWNDGKNKKIISGIDRNYYIQKRTKLTNISPRQQQVNDEAIEKVNDKKEMLKFKGSRNLIRQLRRVARNVNKVVMFILICSFLFYFSKDLSNGLEAIPIPVTNEFDNSPITPNRFTYITSIQVAKNVTVPSFGDYECECKGKSCRTSKTCCARLNNEFPYVRPKNCSRLIKAKDIVFECGPRCGCGPDCLNKVSQKGLQYQLEVYRTPNKGWVVRTHDFIPFGALVCEVVGELKKSEDLDNTLHNDYIFEIDSWETLKEIGGREKRLPDEPLPAKIFLGKEDDETTKNDPEFCIDCNSFGNVTRFINHSCEPNLFVQCILNSHYDVKQARIALFAGRYIRPYQELTYDYGYQLDSVVDVNGSIKQSPCYCGEVTCRKRLY
ncbi:hypothetical protein VNO78_32281 [Psophocarpus tetragonolobus]|uniref:Histone-lysine N-methyltransferase n=1 Tax=Psophocarpus tetragonolobus TaxID=3891 RepID=A0AAN9NW76_PSOTE